MREYVFSLTYILLYKYKIVQSVLIRENAGQWKPVSPIFYAEFKFFLSATFSQQILNGKAEIRKQIDSMLFLEVVEEKE